MFKWGQIEGIAFCQAIQESYKQIVHWKRNLFKVPSGQAGKSFVRELTRMFQSYANASALESVALQAAMVMPFYSRNHIRNLKQRSIVYF